MDSIEPALAYCSGSSFLGLVIYMVGGIDPVVFLRSFLVLYIKEWVAMLSIVYRFMCSANGICIDESFFFGNGAVMAMIVTLMVVEEEEEEEEEKDFNTEREVSLGKKKERRTGNRPCVIFFGCYSLHPPWNTT